MTESLPEQRPVPRQLTDPPVPPVTPHPTPEEVLKAVAEHGLVCEDRGTTVVPERLNNGVVIS